jgi:hypothetical protein
MQTQKFSSDHRSALAGAFMLYERAHSTNYHTRTGGRLHISLALSSRPLSRKGHSQPIDHAEIVGTEARNVLLHARRALLTAAMSWHGLQ